MKASGILNPELIQNIARIGHTQKMVICDAGLPIPYGAVVVDISLEEGVPSIRQAMRSVAKELIVDSYIYASEANTQNPAFVNDAAQIFQGVSGRAVSHEAFKTLCDGAGFYLRTGEMSSFANIILIAGVNF